MSEPSIEKLSKIVNSSGFPLQIGLQHQIEANEHLHGWKFLSKEHPWRNDETNNSGFIDLILEFNYQRLVIECKRVRDTQWIFLNPLKSQHHARVWRTVVKNSVIEQHDWWTAPVNPSSSESEFCVVPGQDNNSKPMLERTASELIDATETIAKEELILNQKGNAFLGVYYSAIVTTAALHVCKFNPQDISLENGEIVKPEFEVVPFIRFRKSLSTKLPLDDRITSLKEVVRAQDRTVFVVTASKIIDFLKDLDMDRKANPHA